MKKIFMPVLVILVFAISSCYYDNLEELHPGTTCVIPDTVSYLNDVHQIMIASCGSTQSSCHRNQDVSNNFVGLNTHSDVVDAINKKLMDAINHNGNALEMPKGGGKLDDCSINKIQKWIDQGAINN